MGDGHTGGVTGTHLQSIQTGNLDHGFGSHRDRVSRLGFANRQPADPHAHVGMDRDFCAGCAGFGESYCPGDIPGDRSPGIGVDNGSENSRPGFLGQPGLLMGKHARQQASVMGQLAMHAEDEFSGHADFNTDIRILCFQSFGCEQGCFEIRIAGSADRVDVDAVSAGLVKV